MSASGPDYFDGDYDFDDAGDAGDLAVLDDDALVERVNGGDVAAFGELFMRHRASAIRAARRVVDPSTAEDVVAESFYKLLRLYGAGRGPDSGFHPYLLRVVRNAAIDTHRRRREAPVEAHTLVEPTPSSDASLRDPSERVPDCMLALQALMRLPDRWRRVLWLAEVEGLDRHQIGRIMDLRPEAVSTLSSRAREGLRQAYLAAHSTTSRSPECATVSGLLPAYVRGRASRRDVRLVQRHVDSCRDCSAVVLELTDLNTNVGAVLVPAFLGLAGLGRLVGTDLVRPLQSSAAGHAPAPGAIPAARQAPSSTSSASHHLTGWAAAAAAVAALGIGAVELEAGNLGTTTSAVGAAHDAAEPRDRAPVVTPERPRQPVALDARRSPRTQPRPDAQRAHVSAVEVGSTARSVGQTRRPATLDEPVSPHGEVVALSVTGPQPVATHVVTPAATHAVTHAVTPPTPPPTPPPPTPPPTMPTPTTPTPPTPPSTPTTPTPPTPPTTPLGKRAPLTTHADIAVEESSARLRQEEGLPVHVTVPVDADGLTALSLSIDIGAPQVRFVAHTDTGYGAFGPWNCTDSTSAERRSVATVISCSLDVQPGAPTALGIDLDYPGGPSLVATVDARANEDPNRDNNTSTLQLPVVTGALVAEAPPSQP